MSADKLEEIKARLAAATPGTWKRAFNGISLLSVFSDENKTVICLPPKPNENHPLLYSQYEQPAFDLDFIAHAHEDIPFLLAEVERLQSALDQLKWADDNLREVTDTLFPK